MRGRAGWHFCSAAACTHCWRGSGTAVVQLLARLHRVSRFVGRRLPTVVRRSPRRRSCCPCCSSQVLAAHRILSAPVVVGNSGEAGVPPPAGADKAPEVCGFIDIRDLLSSFLHGAARWCVCGGWVGMGGGEGGGGAVDRCGCSCCAEIPGRARGSPKQRYIRKGAASSSPTCGVEPGVRRYSTAGLCVSVVVRFKFLLGGAGLWVACVFRDVADLYPTMGGQAQPLPPHCNASTHLPAPHRPIPPARCRDRPEGPGRRQDAQAHAHTGGAGGAERGGAGGRRQHTLCCRSRPQLEACASCGTCIPSASSVGELLAVSTCEDSGRVAGGPSAVARGWPDARPPFQPPPPQGARFAGKCIKDLRSLGEDGQGGRRVGAAKRLCAPVELVAAAAIICCCGLQPLAPF